MKLPRGAQFLAAHMVINILSDILYTSLKYTRSLKFTATSNIHGNFNLWFVNFGAAVRRSKKKCTFHFHFHINK